VFWQAVYKKVTIDSTKMVRKLLRIQHLFAQITGQLRSEEDEVTMIQFKLERANFSIFTMKL
jgi:isochorismate synthase EntC